MWPNTARGSKRSVAPSPLAPWAAAEPSIVPATSLREAIVAAILADTTCANLVGTRVRPDRPAEKDLLPAIVCEIVSNERVHSLHGPAGVSRARVELATFARTMREGFAGMNALRNLFDGFVGDLHGVMVLECSLDEEADENEYPQEGTDLGTYEVPIDFFFLYRESIPSS